MTDESWETLISYPDAIQAHYMRQLLEGEGIEAMVTDENISTMIGYTVAFGGVKVQVRKRDLERGLEVLERLKENPPDEEQEDQTSEDR